MNPETLFALFCNFDSFKDLETSIKALKDFLKAVFIKKKVLKSCWLATTGSVEHETIVYEHLLYECKHVTQRASQSKGLRPNQRSLNLGCPVRIKVKMVKVGEVWKQQVIQSNLVHAYHYLTKENVDALPRKEEDQDDPSGHSGDITSSVQLSD